MVDTSLFGCGGDDDDDDDVHHVLSMYQLLDGMCRFQLDCYCTC